MILSPKRIDQLKHLREKNQNKWDEHYKNYGNKCLQESKIETEEMGHFIGCLYALLGLALGGFFIIYILILFISFIMRLFI